MPGDIFKRMFLIEQIFATTLSVNNKLLSKGDSYFNDITIRQMMAIIAILHLPDEEATINNIAKKLTATKQSTKSIINNLEKKGYVKVESSATDKRAVNVKVTEAGKEIFIKNKETTNEFLKSISSKLTIEEMDTLWALLKKLYEFDGEKMDGFEEEVNYKLMKK